MNCNALSALGGYLITSKFQGMFNAAMKLEEAQARIIKVLTDGYGLSGEKAEETVRVKTDEMFRQAATTDSRNSVLVLDGLERIYNELLLKSSIELF